MARISLIEGDMIGEKGSSGYSNCTRRSLKVVGM